MASQIAKKISAPLVVYATNAEPTLITVGKSAPMNAEVTINGNLIVRGTQTIIDSVDTNIKDNIITLNAGLAANVAPTLDAGIEVDRGSSPTVGVRWNESTDRWQISNDGITYNNIATTGAGGNYISDIVEDLTPQLGGDLDVNGMTITSLDGVNIVLAPGDNIQVDGVMQLTEMLVAPSTAVIGASLVYAGPEDGGGTGVYVTNEHAVHQELVTKKKARLFALIF